MNFARNVLIRNARSMGERIAIICGDQAVSHLELNGRVNRTANALRARGVGKGNVIGLFLKNSLPFVDLFFASHKLGGTLAPANIRYKAHELRHQLSHSGAKFLAFDADFTDIVDEARADAVVETYVCVGGAAPKWAEPYEEFVGDASTLEPPQPDVSPSDVSAILYTSGTTGVAKGVPMHYWGGLYIGALETNADIRLSDSDVTLCVAPLFHQAAHCFVLLMPLMVGGTVVILPKFDPSACISAIDRHKVTFSFLVPTMAEAILRSPALPARDTSSFQKLLSSGSALSEPTKQALLEAFPKLEIFENYGATESFNSTRLLPADTLRKQNCAGLPLPSQQVRIVNKKNADVAAGEVGEVIVKGPATFRGYLNPPDGAEEVIDADGWFHTGDLGRFDAEGYVYIVGRAKELIISGGENILPKEIEDTILQVPGVQACAVIGIPDAYWGEVVCAAVVNEPNADVVADVIIQACSETLAGYKKPRRVEFLTELPRNAAGKVVKGRLKKIILAREASGQAE